MLTKRNWFIALMIVLCASSMAEEKANRYTLLYPSIDQRGDSLTLSGVVCIPANNTPKGIILVPHYTIASRYESPSIKMTNDGAAFLEDYIVLMPDYLGYGITADSIHPYLHGPLTARNCVDMLIHAESILDSLGFETPIDSLYIVGYSQGGASALWTLRLIEEEYADRYHVIRCYAGDGPYDVAATYDEAVEHNHVALPIVVPMLVMGSNAAYDMGWDRTDYFTKDMERIYSRYMEKKDHGLAFLYFMMPSHFLCHWLKPEAMDKNHPIGASLYAALQRSSLVLADQCPEWTPKSPVYLYHSTNDNMVSFRCAEHLYQCWQGAENITFDFGRYGNHLYAARHFYRLIPKLLKESEGLGRTGGE